jgi:hypothetical protein
MNTEFEYMDENGQPQIGTNAWEFVLNGDTFQIICNNETVLSETFEGMEEWEIRDDIAELIAEHCGFEFELAADLAEEVVSTGSQLWFS